MDALAVGSDANTLQRGRHIFFWYETVESSFYFDFILYFDIHPATYRRLDGVSIHKTIESVLYCQHFRQNVKMTIFKHPV